MRCYNPSLFKPLNIVLYLYETNPYILVAIDELNQSKVLELREMKLRK
jgi:hypothetical protein